VRREPAPDGTQFFRYLLLSGAARFVVEFVRINPPILFGLTEAQLTSALLVAVGGWQLLSKRTWRAAAA
jgi:phosphatidylglycerol:prolipoprotein diacylglycerol transferase